MYIIMLIWRLKRHLQHNLSTILLKFLADCIFMTSDEGDFYHKSVLADGTACGAYIFSEPDETIEVHFNYLDVPCENGGLVSVRTNGFQLILIQLCSNQHEFHLFERKRIFHNQSGSLAIIINFRADKVRRFDIDVVTVRRWMGAERRVLPERC